MGAVIDLGYCLDLVTSNGIQAIENVYGKLSAVVSASGAQMPENVGGEDLLQRKLDCAVINYLHVAREQAKEQPFDPVRGVFTEDEHIYANSGFRRKTHIQICVRNSDMVKGVFRVPPQHFSV